MIFGALKARGQGEYRLSLDPLDLRTIADALDPPSPARTPPQHGSDPALHAYLWWRNANARHRDVLAAEPRERTRIRSEKGIR